MAAIITVDKPENSNLGGNTAAEKGKAVKLAKRGAFQSQISLFQRSRNTPVFIGQLLPFSFDLSHGPYRGKLYSHENSNQSPFFSQQRSTVLLVGK